MIVDAQRGTQQVIKVGVILCDQTRIFHIVLLQIIVQWLETLKVDVFAVIFQIVMCDNGHGVQELYYAS